jgi:hypothetical protein
MCQNELLPAIAAVSSVGFPEFVKLGMVSEWRRKVVYNLENCSRRIDFHAANLCLGEFPMAFEEQLKRLVKWVKSEFNADGLGVGDDWSIVGLAELEDCLWIVIGVGLN